MHGKTRTYIVYLYLKSFELVECFYLYEGMGCNSSLFLLGEIRIIFRIFCVQSYRKLTTS
jgi:hypothetical protein